MVIEQSLYGSLKLIGINEYKGIIIFLFGSYSIYTRHFGGFSLFLLPSS